MDHSTLSSLSGVIYQILPATIGGVEKSEFPAWVRSTCQLSSCAEQTMRSSQFGVLPKREERMLILLSARQLGWARNPTLTELFDAEFLGQWSLANLAGHDIALNPAEVGPHLAIQYQDQPVVGRVAIAMEPIVWSTLKYPAIFVLERTSKTSLMLMADWLDPEDDIPFDLPFAFWLKKR
jgi:hypothetical protein